MGWNPVYLLKSFLFYLANQLVRRISIENFKEFLKKLSAKFRRVKFKNTTISALYFMFLAGVFSITQVPIMQMIVEVRSSIYPIPIFYDVI